MPIDDILDSYPEHLEPEDAARLLSLICPDHIRNSVQLSLGSPASFAALLHRRSSLINLVKEARISRNFDQTWEMCISYSQYEIRYPGGTQRALALLSEISSNIQRLVKENIDTPLWRLAQTSTPMVNEAIIETMDLQSLMRKKKIPSFLFYDLGSFQREPVLNERIQKLFSKGMNTSSSATGKTRLLYEGLFQNWGIYITARTDHQEARALQTTLTAHFSSAYELVPYLPDQNALGFQLLVEANLEALHRRFSLVLLTYLLVFRDFLKAAHSEGVIGDEDLRHRWLLAQLWTPCIDKRQDVYDELLECLEWEPLTKVNAELRKVIDSLKPLLPALINENGLFVVIDEANVATKQMWHAYGERHPVIRSIIRTWRDQLASLDMPVTFIVAGTEISKETFPSNSAEWSGWWWTSDTGSFDNREVQRRYILPFLSPSYSGKALLERIWKWCQPRHRLTTVILAMLLEDKMLHPHGVLNRYIEKFTDYEATDAANFVAEEGPCNIVPLFRELGKLVQDSLLSRVVTHEVVFYYNVTGQHPPPFTIDRLELVTSAVGQFRDGNMSIIAIDQPIPTIAAAIWMGDNEDGTLEFTMQGYVNLRSLNLFETFCFFYRYPFPNGGTYSAVGCIAWHLAYAFKDGCTLSDVFAIPAPMWLEDTSILAHLVILRKNRDGVLQDMIVDESGLDPTSPSLGYVANTLDDVVAWLKQDRLGAFCMCPPESWAEIIFVLKVRGKYVWVALRAAGHQDTLKDEDLNLEFDHLTENNLFSRRAGTPGATAHQNDLSNVLKSLPNTVAPPNSFPMLRVVASFPDEPLISPNVIDANANGPVAALKVDLFRAVTESFSSTDLVEGLISSMHGRRLFYRDDNFSTVSLETGSDRRKGKRKDSSLAETSRDNPSQVTSADERPIRPIPRYMSRPASPTSETDTGTSLPPVGDVAEEDEPLFPPPAPKRLKQQKATRDRYDVPDSRASPMVPSQHQESQ